MAQLDPMIHLDAFHGKYGRTDRVYARVRKFDNRTLGIALKHPVTNNPPTEEQKAVQEKFKTVQTKVKTILADPAQRAQYLAEWKAQRKYTTLRGYVFAKLYNDETA